MANDLIAPAGLSGLPGAPFTDVEVDAAVEALRGVLGWHLAPLRTETVLMDVNWPARWMTLPTRMLVSVSAIRDLDTGETIPADRYRTSTHLHSVRQCGSWPVGYESVEADMEHGYEKCPADLLPVIAELAGMSRGATKGDVTTVSNGIYSVGFGDLSGASTPAPFSTAATVARYSLRDEVVIA